MSSRNTGLVLRYTSNARFPCPSAGLVRYDGNTFERLDSTQGVNSISSLYVDKQDRLWIGTNDNGVAVMENGKFRFWDEKDGLGSSKINDIEGDDEGCIYVGTTAGIQPVRANGK